MADPLSNVRFSRRAQRDLDGLEDADVRRIADDLERLAAGTLPGQIKPIPTLPGRPLQADVGRFRVLFRWVESVPEVIAVFPKSDQRKVFKGLR